MTDKELDEKRAALLKLKVLELTNELAVITFKKFKEIEADLADQMYIATGLATEASMFALIINNMVNELMKECHDLSEHELSFLKNDDDFIKMLAFELSKEWPKKKKLKDAFVSDYLKRTGEIK